MAGVSLTKAQYFNRLTSALDPKISNIPATDALRQSAMASVAGNVSKGHHQCHIPHARQSLLPRSSALLRSQR
jgi:hypothetical protein